MIAIAFVLMLTIVVSANQMIALSVNFVCLDITFKINLHKTFQTNLFASPNVNLVTTRTPKMNALNALLFAKNALPTQCVLLATKFPSPPLLLHASVHLGRITLIMVV